MKRINLLTRQKKHLQIDQFFDRIKYAIGGLVLLFLIVFFAFFLILSDQRKKIDDLFAVKKSILEYLLQNQEVEAKFIYFRNKENQMSKILKDDVNFYPYYNLLKESLSSSSPEAQLESVLIDKNKTVNFIVSFTNYESLLAFFKFAESDEFLSNFNLLVLSNFSNAKSEPQKYELGFKGAFHQLK